MPPDLTPYGRERWETGMRWKPGLKPDADLSHIDVRTKYVGKPFLTAADIVFLRDMKVGLNGPQ